MSTLTPLVSMGVITMKMISSTSITSTIGVTLMSDVTEGASGFFIQNSSFSRSAGARRPGGAARTGIQLAKGISLLTRAGFLRPLDEVIEQLRTGVAHFHVKRLNAPREVVVHPHRGNSDEQTD